MRSQKILFLHDEKLIIPCDIDQFYMVRQIFINNANIKIIPDELFNLTKLKSIIVNHNKILLIPDTIIKLQHLKYFCARNNLISSLPNCLFSMTQLNTLTLSNNRITDIPKEIGNLIKLRKLDISKNLVKNIPKVIIDLPNLKFLYWQSSQPRSNLLGLISKSHTNELSNIKKDYKGEDIIKAPYYNPYYHEIDIQSNQIIDIKYKGTNTIEYNKNILTTHIPINIASFCIISGALLTSCLLLTQYFTEDANIFMHNPE